MAGFHLPFPKVVCGRSQGLSTALGVLCVWPVISTRVCMWGQARRAAEAEICTQRLRVPARSIFSAGRVVYGVV